MPDEDERKSGRTDELYAVQKFVDAARHAVEHIERIEQKVPAGALVIPPRSSAAYAKAPTVCWQASQKQSCAPGTPTQSPSL
jgi:hypothetical protein